MTAWPWEEAVARPEEEVERLPHTQLRESTKAKAALCARCSMPVWYGYDFGPAVCLNPYPVTVEQASILAANGRDIYYVGRWFRQLTWLDPEAFDGEYNRDSLHVQHICRRSHP